jgi:hypothetical protein
MIQKELKISFTVLNARYQPYNSGISKKTGNPYEIDEAIIIEDTMKIGNKLDVVEIHIKGESEDLKSIDPKAIIGKSFTGVKASGSKTFYIMFEDIKLK